jgi:hypothetical protein
VVSNGATSVQNDGMDPRLLRGACCTRDGPDLSYGGVEPFFASSGYMAGPLSKITHLNQDLDPSNLRGPRSWLLYRHFEQGDIEGYCRSATPMAYRLRTRKMPFHSH